MSTRRKTTAQFIEEAKRVHGDRYDYSLSEYTRAKDKVKIVCSVHGIFSQTPDKHLNGQGCPRCKASKPTKTTKSFIEEARRVHADRYDYSQVEYKLARDKVKIICSEHGIFEQTPDSHLNKRSGCQMCSGNVKKTTAQFIEEARAVHGDRYTYSLVSYQTNHTKVKIVCPEHGIFSQTPDKHLNGQGCPKCAASKPEKDIMNYFQERKDRKSVV